MLNVLQLLWHLIRREQAYHISCRRAQIRLSGLTPHLPHLLSLFDELA